MERSEKLYGTFFKKYYKAIYNYTNKLLKGDSDTAEDATQHAFVKLWDNFEKMESEKNVKAYLYIVSRNACFNELDKIKRHPAVPVETALPDLLFEFDFDIVESEVIAFIHAEIKKMPKGMREAIELLMSGYNSTVAGNKLGITRKTILNQKLKAIAHLRKLVKLKYDI